MRISLVLLAVVAPLAAAPASPAETIEQLATGRGARMLYILVTPDGPARGAAILLSGGNGRLRLERGPEDRQLGNFLVRTRGRFAAAGIVVAVPDAPSDHRRGGLVGLRTSAEHIDDLGRLVAALRARFRQPVWLVGTSRGTISAVAAAGVPGVRGVVLTSSLTQPGRRFPATVYDAPLGRLRGPVLIVHHRADDCPQTPPGDVERLRAAFTAAAVRDVLYFEGGLPPRSDPCRPFAPHGFFGIEGRVVAAIAGWMLRH